MGILHTQACSMHSDQKQPTRCRTMRPDVSAFIVATFPHTGSGDARNAIGDSAN